MLDQLILDIQTDWKTILTSCCEKHSNALDDLWIQHDKTYGTDLKILPEKQLIFNAFNHFNICDTKVVIIGQDVYPTVGDGMGLCFSVPSSRRCAASLRNIFKEIYNEYGVKRTDTDLTDWAKQGVLLLNTALTVREASAGSHIKYWKPFTWDVVSYIASEHKHIVYILWGAHAQEYASILNHDDNLVLKSIHPSPLAARSGSFVGNNHFCKANDYLQKFDKAQIVWV